LIDRLFLKNVNAQNLQNPAKVFVESMNLIETGYQLKINSNAGRAFVFHQLGIPVIGEFSPSHFHVLGNPQCGYLAHSTAGWLNALRDLSHSALKRAEMAEMAFREFKRLYDPLEWAQRLYQQMEYHWKLKNGFIK